MKNCKPVLSIEDDNVGVMTVRCAFKELKVTNFLTRAVNPSHEARLPYIILGDLNMSEMNDMDFINVVKADKIFRKISADILSTCRVEHGIFAPYKLCVSGDTVKPVDYTNTSRRFVPSIRIGR